MGCCRASGGSHLQGMKTWFVRNSCVNGSLEQRSNKPEVGEKPRRIIELHAHTMCEEVEQDEVGEPCVHSYFMRECTGFSTQMGSDSEAYMLRLFIPDPRDVEEGMDPDRLHAPKETITLACADLQSFVIWRDTLQDYCQLANYAAENGWTLEKDGRMFDGGGQLMYSPFDDASEAGSHAGAAAQAAAVPVSGMAVQAAHVPPQEPPPAPTSTPQTSQRRVTVDGAATEQPSPSEQAAPPTHASAPAPAPPSQPEQPIPPPPPTMPARVQPQVTRQSAPVQPPAKQAPVPAAAVASPGPQATPDMGGMLGGAHPAAAPQRPTAIRPRDKPLPRSVAISQTAVAQQVEANVSTGLASAGPAAATSAPTAMQIKAPDTVVQALPALNASSGNQPVLPMARPPAALMSGAGLGVAGDALASDRAGGATTPRRDPHLAGNVITASSAPRLSGHVGFRARSARDAHMGPMPQHKLTTYAGPQPRMDKSAKQRARGARGVVGAGSDIFGTPAEASSSNGPGPADAKAAAQPSFVSSPVSKGLGGADGQQSNSPYPKGMGAGMTSGTAQQLTRMPLLGSGKSHAQALQEAAAVGNSMSGASSPGDDEDTGNAGSHGPLSTGRSRAVQQAHPSPGMSDAARALLNTVQASEQAAADAAGHVHHSPIRRATAANESASGRVTEAAVRKAWPRHTAGSNGVLELTALPALMQDLSVRGLSDGWEHRAAPAVDAAGRGWTSQQDVLMWMKEAGLLQGASPASPLHTPPLVVDAGERSPDTERLEPGPVGHITSLERLAAQSPDSPAGTPPVQRKLAMHPPPQSSTQWAGVQPVDSMRASSVLGASLRSAVSEAPAALSAADAWLQRYQQQLGADPPHTGAALELGATRGAAKHTPSTRQYIVSPMQTALRARQHSQEEQKSAASIPASSNDMVSAQVLPFVPAPCSMPGLGASCSACSTEPWASNLALLPLGANGTNAGETVGLKSVVAAFSGRTRQQVLLDAAAGDHHGHGRPLEDIVPIRTKQSGSLDALSHLATLPGGLASLASSTASLPSATQGWNSVFQGIKESQEQSLPAAAAKHVALSALQGRFCGDAIAACKQIVQELSLCPADRSIQCLTPLQGGSDSDDDSGAEEEGDAQHSLYMHGGMLLRLVHALDRHDAQNDATAAKTAAAEVRHLGALQGAAASIVDTWLQSVGAPKASSVQPLPPPLTCALAATVDVAGFRFLALASVPELGAGRSTLVHGRANETQPFLRGNASLESMLRLVGKHLGLQAHTVRALCYQDSPAAASTAHPKSLALRDITIPLSSNLQVHLGHDRRFYVFNAGRLMPPAAAPGDAHSALCHLFRPSALATASPSTGYKPLPISADAFSSDAVYAAGSGELKAARADGMTGLPCIGEAPDAGQQDSLATAASVHMMTVEIPALATRLSCLRLLAVDAASIRAALHAAGVNIRLLGLVAQRVTTPAVLAALEVDMLARAFKAYVGSSCRAALRSAITHASTASNGGTTAIHCTKQALELLFGSSASSMQLHLVLLRKLVKEMFQYSLPQSRSYAAGCTPGGLPLLGLWQAVSYHCNLTPEPAHAPQSSELIQRVMAAASSSLDGHAVQALTSGAAWAHLSSPPAGFTSWAVDSTPVPLLAPASTLQQQAESAQLQAAGMEAFVVGLCHSQPTVPFRLSEDVALAFLMAGHAELVAERPARAMRCAEAGIARAAAPTSMASARLLLLYGLAAAPMGMQHASHSALAVACDIFSNLLGRSHPVIPLARATVTCAMAGAAGPQAADAQALDMLVANVQLVEPCAPAPLAAAGAIAAAQLGQTTTAYRLSRSALTAFDLVESQRGGLPLPWGELRAHCRCVLSSLPECAAASKVASLAALDALGVATAAHAQGDDASAPRCLRLLGVARGRLVEQLRGGDRHAEAASTAVLHLGELRRTLPLSDPMVLRWLAVVASVCTQRLPLASQYTLHRLGAAVAPALQQQPSVAQAALSTVLAGRAVQETIHSVASLALQGVGNTVTTEQLRSGVDTSSAAKSSNVQWGAVYSVLSLAFSAT